MYGTSLGHGMAYEVLSKNQSSKLETETYVAIVKVLKNPPSFMVDEAMISPTFNKKYGSINTAFEWAHTLHFQTIDVLSHKNWTEDQKDAEIERLWNYYQSQPFALTGTPMNMEYLDSFPYSQTFRKQAPKVNGLFWGYHWLQAVNYDMLYRTPTDTHVPQYKVIGGSYHETELYKTDRDFMPMTAEMSPRFARKYPHIANAFDNLHMLHDNVNDILIQPWSDDQKQLEVNRAIVRVLASTHKDCKPGEGTPNSLHDHRHAPSTPGMGMMRGSEGDIMFMSGMGWMDMSVCAHCSVSMSDDLWATVTANGWTMSVRCLMCARDMASETPGKAIIRSSTEDPAKTLVLISDDEGNWTSNIASVMFLEEQGEHPSCSIWSRAFTTIKAFDAYAKTNNLKDAKPLTLSEWSARNGGKPDTYQKITRPNPYREGGTK